MKFVMYKTINLYKKNDLYLYPHRYNDPWSIYVKNKFYFRSSVDLKYKKIFFIGWLVDFENKILHLS